MPFVNLKSIDGVFASMKNWVAPLTHVTRRAPFISGATTLAAVIAASLPQPAPADPVTSPRVPANIQVPEGNKAFFVGHAVGTQNYVCLPSGNAFAWILYTPEATLFDEVVGRLRHELPELIDQVLREHFEKDLKDD